MDRETVHILGICGSLRRRSFNSLLLDHAATVMPPGAELVRFDLAAIPLYNQDIEVAGLPEAVVDFKAAIDAADGLFIASPEYNHGMSGVLKNALDWQSRPRGDASITGKPIAFVTVSNGPTGGVRAQGELKRVLASNFALLFPFPEFALPLASQKFTGGGELTDEFALAQLPKMVGEFVDFVRRHR